MIEAMFNSTQASLVPSCFPHIQQLQKNARSQATMQAVLPKNISAPKKPMRPLTAYHIFFQIEREYIIQNLDGEDADKSIHKGKRYMTDVPARYLNIKLSPDWYAGPGKRKKRKHRKSHGKIGFLELSREISTRWAKLEELDSETKHFVKAIAQSELEEYHREVKEYKTSTTICTVTSNTLPERKEPLVKSEKSSPLSQYQQTFRRPYYPYEEQFHSHFEQPMHFQAPAHVLSNSVSLDSETKHFVKAIAKSELMEYRLEMKEYKASTKTGAVASKITPLPVRKERPFVKSEKSSSPQKYQQTLPHHDAHPYKTQEHIHFEQQMHFQSNTKSYLPSSVSFNSVLDIDNSIGCDLSGIYGDVGYFLSCLDEEEKKYCQQHDLLGDDTDSSNIEAELGIGMYNSFYSDTTKRSIECNVNGASSQEGLCGFVSKRPALDHEHKQPEAKRDTSGYVDIGDDDILKLWAS